MSVTEDTFQEEMSPLKDVAPANMPNIFVTEETSQLFRGWLKDVAPANMPNMPVTEDTSHAEILPLNLEAS